MAKIEVVLPGFPGKTSRGALGFCNIVLVRNEKNILFDVGHFSDRPLLISELKKRGLRLEDIDVVVLSHLHYDHCLNVDLFEGSVILVSEEELEYASSNEPQRLGDFYVSKIIVDLIEDKKIMSAEDGMELERGVRVIKTPGHTPGGISLIIEGERRIAIAGDIVKNAWEFRRGMPEGLYGRESDAKESINKLKEMADLIIPGHDRCFLYKKGRGEISFASDLDLRIFAKMDFETDRWTFFSISTTKTA